MLPQIGLSIDGATKTWRLCGHKSIMQQTVLPRLGAYVATSQSFNRRCYRGSAPMWSQINYVTDGAIWACRLCGHKSIMQQCNRISGPTWPQVSHATDGPTEARGLCGHKSIMLQTVLPRLGAYVATRQSCNRRCYRGSAPTWPQVNHATDGPTEARGLCGHKTIM